MEIETGKLKGENYPKFFPNSVEVIELALKQFQPELTKGLRKNIVYSFQYLEFLNFILSDQNKYLRITEVLKTQIMKTFIVTSISIVEGFLYHLLCTNPKTKNWNLDKWKSIKKVSTNEFKIREKKLKITNELFGKLDDPRAINVTLDQMIKKTKDKKLLGDNQELYKKLNYLRKLRNKVHPYLSDTGFDTDYITFKIEDVQVAKNVIYEILNSLNLFDEEIFSFLK